MQFEQYDEAADEVQPKKMGKKLVKLKNFQ